MQPSEEETTRTGDALIGSSLGFGASLDGFGGAILAPEAVGETFEDGCRAYDGDRGDFLL